MAKKTNRWTIKTAEGKVFGPYTKIIIFSLIKKGALAGTELMASYPGGEYGPISQSTEFYDKFLEAWESEIEPLSEERKVEELDSATQIDNSQTGDFLNQKPLTQVEINAESKNKSSDKREVSKAEPAEPGSFHDATKVSSEDSPFNDKQDAKSVSFVDNVSINKGDTNTWTPEDEDSKYGKAIKESSFHSGERDERFSQSQMNEVTHSGVAKPKKNEYTRVDNRVRKNPRRQGDPKFKFVVVFCAIFLAYFLYDEHPAEKIREADKVNLRPIKMLKDRKKISKKKWFGIKSKALKLIEQDTYKNYSEAMNLLVDSVNTHGPDVESIGLLCTVYNELWPYAEQDVKDLSALSKATQLVSRYNIAGVATANCRSVQFLRSGNPLTAEQVLNTALENNPSVATFYDLKASIMQISGKFELANSFNNKTAELWPTWKKPRFQLANYQKRIGNYQYAEDSYRLLTDQGDFHKLAAIELGELLVFQKRDYDGASELVNKVADEKSYLPRLWKSKSFYILAVIAEQSGDRKQAANYARQSYELDTKNTVAASYLKRLAGADALSSSQRTEKELMENGDLFFSQRNYLASQAEYKAAFELNPKSERAGIKAAESLWLLNQGDEAIRWLKKVVTKNPKSVDALLQLAKYQIERYRFTEAIKHLSKAKSFERNDFRVIRGYAHYEYSRRNYKSAKEYSEKAIGIYDSDIESHLILADSLRYLGAPDQAYKTIARAVSLEPLNVDAQSIYSEILAEFQGSVTGVKYLSNLINTYPSEMKYRISLAKIYSNNNQLNEARSVLIPITQVRSDYKPAFMLLAKTYIQEQKPQEALEAFLNAASLDPTDAEPLVEVGRIYQATNKPQQAIRQYERAARINPNFPRLYFFLGSSYLESGMKEKALQSAMEERKRNPLIADSYLLAGDAHKAMQNYNKAIEEYRRAIEKRPQSAEIYVKLSICYRLIGNLDVAETMLSTAKAKDTSYPEIYLESGIILEKRGQILEAVEAYRRYLGLKPNAKNADMVRRKIQSLE